MNIAFAVALLVLAAAVAVLFAMMGELASRMPGRPEPAVQPLSAERLGQAPARWPPPLAHLTESSAVLLVLSTKCRSCVRVAAQLSELAGRGRADGIAIDLECGNEEIGAAFIAEHRLGAVPYVLDERGAWVSEEFGIRMSPAALVIEDGRLRSAFAFNDLAALLTVAQAEREKVHE